MVSTHADCSFCVYAAMNKDHDMVDVIIVNPNHVCAGAVMLPHGSANWQAWLQCILDLRIPATLTVAKKAPPSEIIASPSDVNYIRCSKRIRCQVVARGGARGESWVVL